MKDTLELIGRKCLLNLVIRGSQDQPPGRYAVFGMALNLPTDLMEKSGGKDIHLIAEMDAVSGGSRVLRYTWNRSPEDILEDGIPAFNDARADADEEEE